MKRLKESHPCPCDGINTIEIALLVGDRPVPIVFLDVAMP